MCSGRKQKVSELRVCDPGRHEIVLCESVLISGIFADCLQVCLRMSEEMLVDHNGGIPFGCLLLLCVGISTAMEVLLVALPALGECWRELPIPKVRYSRSLMRSNTKPFALLRIVWRSLVPAVFSKQHSSADFPVFNILPHLEL